MPRRKSVRFSAHVKWTGLFLLLWATTPVRGIAQIRLADAADFTHYWHTSLLPMEEGDGAPSPVSTSDSTDPDDDNRLVRHRELPGDRFQWKPALREYLLEISIQHGWRFAHEKGTRDATANGPWLHDWIDSIGETRGWDDGDGWHSSYVGHPLNGGI
jgi:hypothetical protein